MRVLKMLTVLLVVVGFSMGCKTVEQQNQLDGISGGSSKSQKKSQYDSLEVPSRFKLKLKYFSFNYKFTIDDNGQKLGTMSEKILSWSSNFHFYDKHGHYLGKSVRRILSWGATIDVYDKNDKKIGVIKEIIHRSLFKVQTTYEILDGSERKIAESVKTDLITTSFEVKDLQGRSILTMKRPLALTEYWNVNIRDQKVVDSRILLSIAAHKSRADHAERMESLSDD